MPQFIVSYVGGDQPSSPEEGQKKYAVFKQWLASLGDAVISPASPFKNTHTVMPDRQVKAGSTTSVSGFTLLQAESMASVLDILKECPFLEENGTLEVSELVQMSS